MSAAVDATMELDRRAGAARARACSTWAAATASCWRTCSAHRGCSGYGIEIADANVLACVAARRQRDPAQPRRRAGAVRRPQLRRGAAARHAAAPAQHREACCARRRAWAASASSAFPNFAHWPNRLRVLRGRMPVTKALPYQWYDTPNIRVGTYADFEVLARKNGLRDPRQLRPAGRPAGAALAQPARQRGGVQVRAGLTAPRRLWRRPPRGAWAASERPGAGPQPDLRRWQ